MIQKVRVRFAPSPTGPLHIGGVRTALFNYFFARQNKGDFILRIEDTDQGRFVSGAEAYIIESLKWCGIEIDEGPENGGPYGPYRQSERKEMYRKYSDILLEKGNAYIAFDTPEELDKLRTNVEGQGNIFTYDHSVRMNLRNSLRFSETETNNLVNSGYPYVVRFKMPENREILLNDINRGEVKVNTSSLDDKVIFKSDGMPTYHLANIVDDHLMKISHVIRGEEWLPSLPLHWLLYEAFEWTDSMPQFAHLPLLLKPAGKGKLSKRDGDKMGFPVFPLEWKSDDGEVSSGYRESGYLPDAFVNLLSLLGWNPGTEEEIFNMNDLIDKFSLEKVGKSGSRFDPDKAKWFNNRWLQIADNSIVASLFMKELDKNGIDYKNIDLDRIVGLVKERVNFASELFDQSYFFFQSPQSYDEKFVKKAWKESSPVIIQKLINILETIDDFSQSVTEEKVKTWIEKEELGMGAVMNAFRLCIVGAGKGPHLFDIIEIIGKDETLKRLQKGLEIAGN